MSIIINMIPSKAEPTTKPSPTDRKAYGAYLVNASGCRECHTREKGGRIIPELAFSGGREFPIPNGTVVRSANLTPDMKTGLGAWTEEMFVNRFKAYVDSSYKAPAIGQGDFTTAMPWTMYGQMNREDLGAIYTYLHSLEPKANQVEKFSVVKK